jgi:hypothetical protein
VETHTVGFAAHSRDFSNVRFVANGQTMAAKIPKSVRQRSRKWMRQKQSAAENIQRRNNHGR